jgi:hypothetical protein
MAHTVTRRRIGIWRGEVLDVLEVERDGEREYYGYTYKVHHSDAWLPLVRWDNLDGEPHVDRYDEAGGFVEKEPTPERRLDEVLRTVNAYRRSVLTMPASEL